MKAEIPETGTVIEVNGKTATVLLTKRGPCKGCSAGRIGLCDPCGGISTLVVMNESGAEKGDIVKIGVKKEIHIKGYLYSFILPVVALIAGAFTGHLTGIDYMEEILGFLSFIIVSVYSMKRLYSLDKTSKLVIKSILSRRISDLSFQEFTH